MTFLRDAFQQFLPDGGGGLIAQAFAPFLQGQWNPYQAPSEAWIGSFPTGNGPSPAESSLRSTLATSAAPVQDGHYQNPPPSQNASGGASDVNVGPPPSLAQDQGATIANLTRRAFGPYVAAYQNFVVDPLRKAVDAAARSPVGDPGLYASLEGLGPPGALAAGIGGAGAYGLRFLAGLGRATELAGTRPPLASLEATGGVLRSSVGDAPHTVPTLPKFDGKTTKGMLVTNEGKMIPLESGSADPAFENYPAAPHVEAKAAIWLRKNSSSGGTVYHNNPQGTCWLCNSNLSTLLPEGVPLTVIPPSNALKPSRFWIDVPKTYTGNSAHPSPP